MSDGDPTNKDFPIADPRIMPVEYTPPEPTIMQMLNNAVQSGKPIEYLKELIALKGMLDEQEEQMRKVRARHAYDVALAEAKKVLPVTVAKTGLASFDTRDGGNMSYRYTSLDDLLKATVPVLAEHGLTHRFNVEQDKEWVTVTCILRHKDGFYEHTSMSGPLDKSGGKNMIQSLGSTSTYLRKYTFEALLGIVGAEDDDGAKAVNVKPQAGPDAMASKRNLTEEEKQKAITEARAENPLTEEQRTRLIEQAHLAAKQGEDVFRGFYVNLKQASRDVLAEDKLSSELRKEMNEADDLAAQAPPS